MSVEVIRNLSNPEISLPEECLTLPPVCQEEVQDVLVRLQRMKEEGSWFKLRTPEELNLLIPQVQEHAKGIFNGLRSYKNGDKWFAAWDAAEDAARNAAEDAARNAAWVATRDAVEDPAWVATRDAARNAAEDAVRYPAWVATRDAARNAAGHAAEDAAIDAAGIAAWEVVKDLPGFETNPFSHLLSLYELGSTGIRFHQVEETAENKKPEEMLIVHFPLELEDRRVLACLAFPDGRAGDKEVKYTHLWESSCSKITFLNPPPQRKIL